MAIFNQFDTDGSNKITEENIYFAMQKFGHEIPRNEIHDMIKKHDLTNDGVLSYEEFKAIFVEKGKGDFEDVDDAFVGRTGPQISSNLV